MPKAEMLNVPVGGYIKLERILSNGSSLLVFFIIRYQYLIWKYKSGISQNIQ